MAYGVEPAVLSNLYNTPYQAAIAHLITRYETLQAEWASDPDEDDVAREEANIIAQLQQLQSALPSVPLLIEHLKGLPGVGMLPDELRSVLQRMNHTYLSAHPVEGLTIASGIQLEASPYGAALDELLKIGAGLTSKDYGWHLNFGLFVLNTDASRGKRKPISKTLIHECFHQLINQQRLTATFFSLRHKPHIVLLNIVTEGLTELSTFLVSRQVDPGLADFYPKQVKWKHSDFEYDLDKVDALKLSYPYSVCLALQLQHRLGNRRFKAVFWDQKPLTDTEKKTLDQIFAEWNEILECFDSDPGYLPHHVAKLMYQAAMPGSTPNHDYAKRKDLIRRYLNVVSELQSLAPEIYTAHQKDFISLLGLGLDHRRILRRAHVTDDKPRLWESLEALPPNAPLNLLDVYICLSKIFEELSDMREIIVTHLKPRRVRSDDLLFLMPGRFTTPVALTREVYRIYARQPGIQQDDSYQAFLNAIACLTPNLDLYTSALDQAADYPVDLFEQYPNLRSVETFHSRVYTPEEHLNLMADLFDRDGAEWPKVEALVRAYWKSQVP